MDEFLIFFGSKMQNSYRNRMLLPLSPNLHLFYDFIGFTLCVYIY